ncbi:MAG: FkbM family methyltransferase [Chthoniobacterales bacterium]|nr:FkbM family methyltransferase [Chthoniobacterales bacterium]
MIRRLKRAVRTAIEAQGYYVRPSSEYGLSLGEDVRRLLAGRAQSRIFDVGANAGQWLTSIKTTLPDARVHCYEPDERALVSLQAAARALNDVTYTQCALGREPGTMTFFRNADSVTSSLLQAAAQTRPLPYAEKLAPVDSVQVEVRTVDDELRRLGVDSIDLLKTDCQGFDLRVLEGASRAIADGRIRLVSTEALFQLEYDGQAWFHEILGWLSMRGFALIGIYDILHDETGRALFGDALFARSP